MIMIFKSSECHKRFNLEHFSDEEMEDMMLYWGLSCLAYIGRLEIPKGYLKSGVPIGCLMLIPFILKDSSIDCESRSWSRGH